MTCDHSSGGEHTQYVVLVSDHHLRPAKMHVCGALLCLIPAARGLSVGLLAHPMLVHRVPVTQLTATGPNSMSSGEPTPAWVSSLNGALTYYAASTVIAFLLVDMVCACCLLGGLIVGQVQVPGEFAVALAISKGPLKAPRVAVEASIAAMLARRYPSLRAVRTSILLEEMAHMWGRLAGSVRTLLHVRPIHSHLSLNGQHARASSLATSTVPIMRRLSDEYGLAYLAAKNVVGPLCTLVSFGALRSSGLAVSQAMAALSRRLGMGVGASGGYAGQVALAATLSHLLFPVSVLSAAHLGPLLRLGRGPSSRKHM